MLTQTPRLPPRAPRSAWRDWVHRPQRLWLRRATFQIHLWIAIAIGLYLTVISVSGSAVVFRREFNQWLVPQTVPSTESARLEGDALRAAAEQTYPQHTVTRIGDRGRAGRPVLVVLEREGAVSERLFDPYAAKDMGLSYPPSVQFVEWLVDLHDNLLAGSTGRTINGWGGVATMVLLGTGAVIWWPGRARWRQSLSLRRPVRSRRFVWQLHSFIGFWAFAMLFIWAITAIYFAFPDPFERTIDRFDPDLNDFERPGEAVLQWFVKMHFGRFGGLEIRVLWVVLGLLPAVLFATGFFMWWTRVVRPAWNRLGRDAPASAQPDET